MSLGEEGGGTAALRGGGVLAYVSEGVLPLCKVVPEPQIVAVGRCEYQRVSPYGGQVVREEPL